MVIKVALPKRLIGTVCLMAVCLTGAKGQGLLRKPVTLVADQWEIQKVVESLQQQSGISFFYSINAIQAQRKITCRYFNIPLRQFLEAVFKPLYINYKVVDEQIVLYAAPALSVLADKTVANNLPNQPNSSEPDVKKAATWRVSGKVLSEKNVPLDGASIVIEGTQTGTVTGKDGWFQLDVPASATRLIISYTAYHQRFAEVTKEGVLDHQLLEPLVAAMDEVVVIGYGTAQRSEMTGASVTVRAAQLEDAPVTTIDAALQGRATGVLVTQQGGTPGAPVRIQVRGTGSVSSGTEPLYIIDGVIIFQEVSGIGDGLTSNSINPLATLNPDDVATIEILKDAAATAIYGARGANGVVLITTKQGRRGSGNVTVSLARGISQPTRTVSYVNGPQWLALVDRARASSVDFGISPGQEAFNPLLLVNNTLPTPSGMEGQQFEPLTTFTRALAERTSTQWTDQLLRQGSITDLKISAGNGFEQGNFYISGQYWDEQGILTNQHLQRFSFRSNLNFKPAEQWRIGSRMFISRFSNGFAQLGTGGDGSALGRLNQGATGGWQRAHTTALPIMPIYDEQGLYFNPLRGNNLVAGADPANYLSRQQQVRFIGSAYLEWKPLKNLELRSEMGADFINSNNLYWVSDVIRYNRRGDETTAAIKNLTANAYATYQYNGTQKEQLILTAGSEWQHSSNRRQSYAFEGLTGSQREIGEIAQGNQMLIAVGGIFPNHIFLSHFARAQYRAKGAWLLSGSIRYDGSSVFAPANRFGVFPSLSAGWLLNETEGWKKSALARKFSFFKLRGSFGITGNANIPAFGFQSQFVNWPVYGQAPALGLSVVASSNIRWEKNEQIDLAWEWAWWNNRIRGSLGVFSRTSRDMLLNVPVAPTVGIGAGAQSVVVNIGNLRNQGLEMELSTVLRDNFKQKNRIKWTADFNLTLLDNKVLRLTDFLSGLPTGNFPVASGIGQGVGITQVGGRLGTFYLAQYAGLDSEGFETIYEIDRAELLRSGRTLLTGNILRATQQNINNNRVILEGKTGLPKWFGGLTQQWQWKNIELRMHITFQGGNYIYEAMEEQTSYVRTGTNVLRRDLLGNTWSADKPDAAYPRLTWNMRDNTVDAQGLPAPQTMGSRTTRFLYRGDFARLKTLSLHVPLPARLLQRLHLQQAKWYVAAQNIFTLTAFPGFDPELLNLGGGTQGRNLNQGFLNSAPVPQARTFMMGFQVVL